MALTQGLDDRALAVPIDDVLIAVGEAAYAWDVASDAMVWSRGAAATLDLPATAQIDTLAAFSALLDSHALATRTAAVLGSTAIDGGEGVAFEIEYPLARSAREQGVWLQERGRWTAGSDGRPQTVVGVVRRLGMDRQGADQVARVSRFDPLTGQLSRARLLEIAGAALTASVRMQTAFSFVLASLGNLGAINEAYGHDVGDAAIVEVARRFRGAMRGGDTLGRFSTSTFGFALQECDRDDLDVVMRRFASAVHDEPVVTPLGPVAVRVAIGGVVAPRHARDVAEMVERARFALSRAANRPSGVCIYALDPEREAARRAHMRLADSLVAALREQRVMLAFQPVFRATTREEQWSEALVRILTEEGEIVSGGPLAQAAEEVGLIHMLDRRVLDLACGHLIRRPEARVAVNVSAATTSEEAWLDALGEWLTVRPDIAGRLMVEITETAAIGDVEVTAGFVRTLRGIGVKVAIDDFGTGHTSFRALKDLSVDLVKIDGSFVRDLETSADSGAFVRALLALARELGFETVAEQVESERVAVMLTEWGATYLQGEALAMPELDPDDRPTSD